MISSYENYDEARPVYRFDLSALSIRAEGTAAPGIANLPTWSVASTGSVGPLTSVDGRFSELALKWKTETELLSDSIEIVLHPAYQQIIGLGKQALPHILRSLQEEPDHWFWALEAISGENPVPEELRGNLRETVDAWIRWGAEHGYFAA